MSKKRVKYKSFDELPDDLKEKYKCDNKLSNSNRVREGYIDFINLLNQRGDELIGDYNATMIKTQVIFGECSHVADITPNNYKHGKGCGICGGKQVKRGVNDLATTNTDVAKEWHPTKNGETTPHDVTQGSGKKVWWQCKYGHEWEARISDRTCGHDCPYCSNKKILKGYNDIATTHPHLIKYFVNLEDAYTHTYSSGKRVELKCPDCGHTKTMQVSKLTGRGFSCDLCSDGYSFCEKLVGSILTKLNIEFIKQLSYDNGKHKYDFYLPKYNAILETHGGQHYRGWLGSEEDLLRQQENDQHKRELAIKSGVKNENYHEVDCRHTTLEYCRPNIELTLSNYIDMSILTDEDWREADIQAQKSLKIEVCKYWEENKRLDGELTTTQVADVFGVVDSTVREYLKWGSTSGFCGYDGEEERKAKNRRISTFVYLIKQNGDKWFDEPMSMSKLAKQSEIPLPTIKRNLDKGALKYNSKVKYDQKYIGSYIVSAKVYDNEAHSN